MSLRNLHAVHELLVYLGENILKGYHGAFGGDIEKLEGVTVHEGDPELRVGDGDPAFHSREYRFNEGISFLEIPVCLCKFFFDFSPVGNVEEEPVHTPASVLTRDQSPPFMDVTYRSVP